MTKNQKLALAAGGGLGLWLLTRQGGATGDALARRFPGLFPRRAEADTPGSIIGRAAVGGGVLLVGEAVKGGLSTLNGFLFGPETLPTGPLPSGGQSVTQPDILRGPYEAPGGVPTSGADAPIEFPNIPAQAVNEALSGSASLSGAYAGFTPAEVVADIEAVYGSAEAVSASAAAGAGAESVTLGATILPFAVPAFFAAGVAFVLFKAFFGKKRLTHAQREALEKAAIVADLQIWAEDVATSLTLAELNLMARLGPLSESGRFGDQYNFDMSGFDVSAGRLSIGLRAGIREDWRTEIERGVNDVVLQQVRLIQAGRLDQARQARDRMDSGIREHVAKVAPLAAVLEDLRKVQQPTDQPVVVSYRDPEDPTGALHYLIKREAVVELGLRLEVGLLGPIRRRARRVARALGGASMESPFEVIALVDKMGDALHVVYTQLSQEEARSASA